MPAHSSRSRSLASSIWRSSAVRLFQRKCHPRVSVEATSSVVSGAMIVSVTAVTMRWNRNSLRAAASSSIAL